MEQSAIVRQTAETKYFSLISTLYVTLVLLTLIIENRLVLIGNIQVLSGTLILPLSYVVSDIITEVYGYRKMRHIIWVSFITLYIAAFIIFIIINLPSVPGAKSIQSKQYVDLFTPFVRDVFTYSIAALASLFFNTYIISKWKILIKGRLFWLRSLGSTAIGEAIFILTWGVLGFSNKFPFKVLLGLMITSYICKIIYNVAAIIPSSLIVIFLKHSENLDTYDYNVNYNPFIWKTD